MSDKERLKKLQAYAENFKGGHFESMSASGQAEIGRLIEWLLNIRSEILLETAFADAVPEGSPLEFDMPDYESRRRARAYLNDERE